MSNENRNVVATAATDLVNRISNEIDYIHRPRYTDMAPGKRQQTNPYAGLSPAEQTEVIIESMTMVLGQIAAMAFSSDEKIDQQSVYSSLNKKIRTHGDAYHQHFLHFKETQKHDKTTDTDTDAGEEDSLGGV